MTDWSSFGLAEGAFNFPELAGKYSGLLIIAASGRCVWDDLEKAGMARNHDDKPHVMCVNDMIMHYPGRVDHAYSNSHTNLTKWVAARRDQYLTRYGQIKNTHSNKIGGRHTRPWPRHGTSTLNACYTAIALGYDEIWLCGAPLDNSGHFWEAPWERSNFENEVAIRDGRLKYWDNAKHRIFEGRVKSFSGRTRDLLGEPKR